MQKTEILKHAKFLIALCFFLLTACSAKAPQENYNSQFVLRSNPHNLSKSELAALNSSGKIDNNIPAQEMEDIAKQYKYFLSKGRQSVCSVNEKSSHYLNYAKKIFKEKGMPEELANLAIVESCYRPTAVSSSGAAGVWQFMPATGMRFGLSQDFWQDERLDPYKATEAAAEYLNYLYEYFGDWPTAIAAYNAGEGKLSRAKEGTGAKDFFEVKARNDQLDEKAKLRDETKNYVPKFMAVTKIMRNLDNLGFDSSTETLQQKFHRLSVAPGTNLTALSKACALPWKDFNIYNPHHKRTITCTDKRTFVYVPENAQKLANEYLNSHQSGEFAGWQPVKLKKSPDSLAKLGANYNISLAALQTANPGVSKLKKGQILILPPNLKAVSSLALRESSSDIKKTGTEHKIAPKETLYGIAKKYNIDPALLQKHNNISNAGTLRSGQILQIPVSKSQAKVNSKKNYVVQPKDSLWSISRKHNISVADLKKWNNIADQQIKPGVVLIVSN